MTREHGRLGGDLDGIQVRQTRVRLVKASIPAALTVGGAAVLGAFFVAARRMRTAELNSILGMVRGNRGH